MHQEPDCFGWDGTGCIALWGECEGKKNCKFYKSKDVLEEERLTIYEASQKKYARYDKKYWLMKINDEFISHNEEKIAEIRYMRHLREHIIAGDADAAKQARQFLGLPK